MRLATAEGMRYQLVAPFCVACAACGASPVGIDASVGDDASGLQDAPVDALCPLLTLDTSTWSKEGSVILDFDPQYYLAARLPGEQYLALVLVPPDSPFVMQPPQWSGTLSPPDVPLCDPASAYPAECSAAFHYGDSERVYEARSGTLTLSLLEPLHPDGTGAMVSAYDFTIRDVEISSSDSECFTIFELRVVHP